MSIRAVRSLTLGFAVLIFSACSGENGTSGNTNSGQGLANETTGNMFQKANLMNATPEQISQHVVACHGNPKDKKVCVSVCHRPPGNPENGKKMILPLSAVSAHLRHGGRPDDLGDCSVAGNEDNETDPGSGDPGSGDTGEDDGDDLPDTPGDLPEWCQANIEIDADCDGVIDDTGVPMY